MGWVVGILRIPVAVLMVLAIFVTGALGQNAPAPSNKFRDRPLTPEESERMYDDMGRPTGVRLYENLCPRAKEFIAKKGQVNDPLLSQFNTMVGTAVVSSLLSFCATGRFVLSFYDENNKCPMKIPLTRLHTQLLTRLPFVRQGDAEIISLACVETSELIFLLNMHAHTVLINDSEFGDVTIGWSSINSRISIQDTVIKGILTVEGTNIGSTLEIMRTQIGTEGSKSNSLLVQKSTLGAIAITDTQFNSDVYIGDNQIKGSARIGRDNNAPDAKRDIKTIGYFTIVRNDVRGDLRVSGADISRDLEMQSNLVERALIVGGNTSVKGSVELFGSRALTMELYGLEVGDQVRAVTAIITGALYVGQSSSGEGKASFKRNLNLTNLKADRVRMLSVNVGEQMTLTSLSANDLSLDDVTVGKKIHSGDARVRALNVRRSTIPWFDCTDCEIAQYVLLAGNFTGEVNLRGAQIRGSLLFRDGDGDGNGAAWSEGSYLDLRNIQVETIEADYCDMLIRPAGSTKCVGRFVPAMITGAKFQIIVPGRHSTTATTAEERSAREGLLDKDKDTIVSWIKTGIGSQVRPPKMGEVKTASAAEKVAGADANADNPASDCERESRGGGGGEGDTKQPGATTAKPGRGDSCFQPQAYDLIAAALDRGGRRDAAIAVRIAKLDHDYSTDNHSWLMKGVAAVARVLTGYGYQNERSVVAFALLIVTGILVFVFGRHVSPVRLNDLKLSGYINVFWYAMWFSIDRAVPPLHIDETMKEYSVLKPLARAYFYFHRGAGTVILSFFVAGVTGLFK